MFEVAPAEDEDPVEAVSADGAHPALGEGVGVRRLDRGGDHFDALAAEDFVEGVAELGVAIVDEEPKLLLFAELHDEVARLWVVETAFLQRIYVLFFISLATRRIEYITCTSTPAVRSTTRRPGTSPCSSAKSSR